MVMDHHDHGVMIGALTNDSRRRLGGSFTKLLVHFGAILLALKQSVDLKHVNLRTS